MRHRIYFPGPLTTADVSITGPELHHAARVVRLREGEPVELFDGRGTAVAGEISAIGRDQIRVRVTGAVPSRESPLGLTVAMAIIQLEKFELVLQKATELGAHAIVPLVTDRIEVRPERYRGKSARWEKIVLEAVKQSGRSAIPRLESVTPFEEATGRAGLKIVFDADVEPSPRPASASEATIFIGPEGGWSERELAQAREQHCTFERLGTRRLRAETAAIAALAVLAARYGDI
ncbi:MAG TPA: RsmE family RNA methyltransferase [Thermoanaerobaculia bacterium]|nr:RsmE family RNA methyltransferase [Thermoanaerobaculia bacterium]